MKILRGLRTSRLLMTTAMAALVGTVILSGSLARADIVFDDDPVTGIIYPNIFSSYITVDYTAFDHHLVAGGGHPEMFSCPNPDPEYLDKLISFYPVQIDGNNNIINGDENNGIWGNYPGFLMDVTLTLDSNNLPIGGTGSLQILGTINYLGASSGTLLTADFQQIIFNDPGGSEELRYIFNTTGGDLAEYYPSQILVIHNWTGFAGSFGGDFSSPGGDSYTCAIPEPCTAILLLTSLGSVVFVFLCRKIRRN